MRRMCRQTASPARKRRQQAIVELLRHASVVSDPKRLAFLNAKVAKSTVVRATLPLAGTTAEREKPEVL